MAEMYATIRCEGIAYIGEHAFDHVRPMQWVQDPMLKHSYMSTAALHQAGNSAQAQGYEGVLSELPAQSVIGPAGGVDHG